MKKIIKKWGDSAVIILTPEELKIYNIKIGDILELEINKYKPEKQKHGK